MFDICRSLEFYDYFLCRCRRPTLYTTASVLKDFLRYLYESEQFTKDLSADVPKPKIYTDEDIPETWTPAEVKATAICC